MNRDERSTSELLWSAAAYLHNYAAWLRGNNIGGNEVRDLITEIEARAASL